MNSDLLEQLKGRNLKNPFSASQSRAFSDAEILKEFYPTSKFWSIFNQQHEVILGTRGSGKTILIRMVCYNLLRQFKVQKAQDLINSKKYIGFLIPLNIDWTISIKPNAGISKYREYFMFSFNCIALYSFLDTLLLIIKDDHSKNEYKRKEIEITSIISRILFDDDLDMIQFSDIKKKLNEISAKTEPWENGFKHDYHVFHESILSPLQYTIKEITGILGENYQDTSWLACIDEADFLPDSFLECINSFMRSTKKPFVLKMTTMPSKYSTRKTLNESVFVEPEGNDFNFNFLDYAWDSADYRNLTNHLTIIRLNEILESVKIGSLEEVIPSLGNEPKDVFSSIMKSRRNETSNEIIIKGIVNSLSKSRQKRYQKIRKDKKKVEDEYLKKFGPVYYPRMMKKIDGTRNNVTGWFSGARVLRQITDGNPRKFIQLMKQIISESFKSDISEKTIQKIFHDFCKREFNNLQSLPKYGFTLQMIIHSVGNFLSNRIHGDVLLDSGCSFKLTSEILSDKKIIEAIKVGVDHNHLRIDDFQIDNLNNSTVIRLSYKYGLYFYLPLRAVSSSSPSIKKINLRKQEEKTETQKVKREIDDNQMELEL